MEGGTAEDGIVLTRDVVFTADERRPLSMHLVQPASQAGPRPVVVFIFGGAWIAGSKDDVLPYLYPLARRGYCGIAIDYRYSTEALFPAQLHDGKCAIRFLRRHGEELGIDADRIGVWGASSGAHLAVFLGITADRPELEGSRGWLGASSRVTAVCDWFGPTDFLRMDAAGSSMHHDAADSPESRLIGGPIQEHPDWAARANPIAYIVPGQVLPPFLIMHGDQDPLVPFNQSELLAAALQSVQAEVQFDRVPGAGHGGPTFETAATLDRVNSFFDRYLQPAPNNH